MLISVATLISLAILINTAFSSPSPPGFQARINSNPTTCNHTTYSSEETFLCRRQGWYYIVTNSKGAGLYPHQFQNHDQFALATKGPWYQFPLVRGGFFRQGMPPGPARCIFDWAGDHAGYVYHPDKIKKGQSAFLGCSGTEKMEKEVHTPLQISPIAHRPYVKRRFTVGGQG
ncbi:ribonuclease [Diplocarpon mali]|nr:ribonuclease [Diplocarpon mali]